jgi:xanthine dehydrogenase accessory factor
MANIAYNDIRQTIVLVRSGGDLASGIAVRLFRSGFKVCLVDTINPLAVRRTVSFCEAVYDGKKTIEGVTAIRINRPEEIDSVWEKEQIPILIDHANDTRHYLKPHVVVDAIVAKRNKGTQISDAPLVIGLGPGFTAGQDVHVVIETNRGHNMGRLIFEGTADPNTGVPGTIAGFSSERVFRAPCDGIFKLHKEIGEMVSKGEQVAHVANEPIHCEIDGIIRGILRDGTLVIRGMKAGDVDPRGDKNYCSTISDKARSLGGAVIETILLKLPEHLATQK